jgi:uncharacterized lipoprotein NlpE involved in copper resistance
MKTPIYFFLFAITLLFHSCGTGESVDSAQASDSNATEAPQINEGHNSEGSLDWMGTYAGILPCSDCEELQAEVTLGENGRFSRKLIYKGKSKTPLLSMGMFEWNEAGSEVTLKSFKGNNQVFKVGESRLIYQLPEGGSREFFLSKVQVEEDDAV